MKQTAVEWLIEQMLDSGIGICKEWRQQAKEMEKQQIIDAYEASLLNEGGERYNIVAGEKFNSFDNSEDYYNETYGSKGS